MPAAPTARVRFRPGYRVVPSRFPPVGVFDAIADPGAVMRSEGKAKRVVDNRPKSD